MMLGYTKEDLDDMLLAVETAKVMVDSDDDPWLAGNLHQTGTFLQGLWAEGYFD